MTLQVRWGLGAGELGSWGPAAEPDSDRPSHLFSLSSFSPLSSMS